MTSPTVPDDVEQGSEARSSSRSRDAESTRRRLLQAARRRFARDGYTATTVREIAADAGVNVALISRYFDSKEGLFDACLRLVVEDLDRPSGQEMSVETMVDSIVRRLTTLPSGEQPIELLLLLRSSGDTRADAIRRSTLKSYAQRMAAAAGWRLGDSGEEALLLRAQIALSTALGITLLRASTGLEPLSSATEQELRGPLGDVLVSLLSPR